MTRQERDTEIVRLRVDERYAYKEIGKRFGITGERVRQVLAKLGKDGLLSKIPKPAKPLSFPLPSFSAKMRLHLRQCGFFHCGVCHWWLDIALRVGVKSRCCSKCNRERAAKWFLENRDRALAYQRKRRRDNPKEVAVARKRYLDKRRAERNNVQIPK